MTDPHIRRLFWFIFSGARGGLSRIKIVKTLRNTPMNTNQLAINLGFDYKAIQHNLRVLEKNNLIVKNDERYGTMYFISPLLEVSMDAFDEIAEKLDKSK